MINNAFSDAGWGWHMETGIHLTKMILGGVFDQFPNLKIVIGHMGEGVTFMAAAHGLHHAPRNDQSEAADLGLSSPECSTTTSAASTSCPTSTSW